MMASKKHFFMIFLGLTIIMFLAFCIFLNLPEVSSNDFGVELMKEEFLDLNSTLEPITPTPNFNPEVRIIIFDDRVNQNDSSELEIFEEIDDIVSVTPKIDKRTKGNFSSSILSQFSPFDEEVACISEHQGYSPSQSSLLFPKKDYLKCSEILRFNPILLSTNDTITVKCLYNNGWFYTENYPKVLSYSDPIPNPLNWTSFSGTIGLKLVTREFVFIKCTSLIKGVYLKLKHSKAASIKSKRKAFSLLQENFLSSSTPLGVHLILLESMSREHFFRSLRSTIHYLNNEVITSSDFLVYDFQNAHSQDQDSISNLIPLLFGLDLNTFKSKSTPNNGESLEEAAENMQKAYSLWSHYENFGFVTYVAFDSVWGLMKEYTGNRVLADHSLIEFWLIAKQVFGYSDYTPKQRCFGDKNSHRHLMDHTAQFVRSYEKQNRFSVTHTSVAAEDTGRVVNSFDLDFKESLQDILKFYQESQEDFVVFIVADSGRDKKKSDFSDEGSFENKHPACFMITSQGLVNKFVIRAHENLQHNTKRLVSKFDLYLTLLHLAVFPYESKTETTEIGIYPDLKHSLELPSAISLFLEKIPNNRTCSDIRINENFCFCRAKEDLDINSNLVHLTLMKLTQLYLNHMNNDDFDGKICKKLTISKPISVQRLKLKTEPEGGNHQIFFKFSVNESLKAEFEFTYYVLLTSEYNRQKPEYHRYKVNITSSTPDTLDKYMAQLQKSKRIDDFQCKSLENLNKLCVCE